MSGPHSVERRYSKVAPPSYAERGSGCRWFWIVGPLGDAIFGGPWARVLAHAREPRGEAVNPAWFWTRSPRFESGRGDAVGGRGDEGGRQLGRDDAEVRRQRAARPWRSLASDRPYDPTTHPPDTRAGEGGDRRVESCRPQSAAVA